MPVLLLIVLANQMGYRIFDIMFYLKYVLYKFTCSNNMASEYVKISSLHNCIKLISMKHTLMADQMVLSSRTIRPN